mmetsp:Transcript_3800/g.17522  ORF Transcript_3800/g.17522 Transcript_3800/m.17522 type:complete len:241 (-) Transcript_3800:43-765(-)
MFGASLSSSREAEGERGHGPGGSREPRGIPRAQTHPYPRAHSRPARASRDAHPRARRRGHHPAGVAVSCHRPAARVPPPRRAVPALLHAAARARLRRDGCGRDRIVERRRRRRRRPRRRLRPRREDRRVHEPQAHERPEAARLRALQAINRRRQRHAKASAPGGDGQARQVVRVERARGPGARRREGGVRRPGDTAVREREERTRERERRRLRGRRRGRRRRRRARRAGLLQAADAIRSR